jgi:FPC/CPF motif-containing protein YcgG
MNDEQTNTITEEYLDYIRDKYFPCIAAKAALAENKIQALVADHLACPKDDICILQFLYNFVDTYRSSKNLYHSAVIIFKGPERCTEEIFDALLWQRLQAISDLDATEHAWDARVEKDAASPDFSFSIKEEAFYIIALQPDSDRKARQFKYPALVFNPHDQFEKLRASNKYIPMRQVVRKRDIKLSGSINPMLADFGESSEVFQYSGRKYDSNWKCPFVSKHESTKHHSSS